MAVPVVDEEDNNKNELANTCYGRGKVSFTQFWIPIENRWDEDNDGERVYLGENQKVDLLDKSGNLLATIPISMHEKCKMEGTCLLENGDIINIDNTTNSFIRVGGHGRENNVFGLGSGSQNLVPFISVASNDLPYGQKLYIKQLDGLDLGKGRIHNGCVRVDDDSWSFNGCQIDFFVLTYLDYLWLDLDLDRVNVKLANCELKNYILKEDMEYIKATNKEEIIPSLMEAKYVEYTE
ncbi:hypothetical protein K501DRAFT_178942 [Backusella circina FSU 941]|nr:hypothetical protein K501DRAFT_178942 [Backusella circina FSU 941]